MTFCPSPTPRFLIRQTLATCPQKKKGAQPQTEHKPPVCMAREQFWLQRSYPARLGSAVPSGGGMSQEQVQYSHSLAFERETWAGTSYTCLSLQDLSSIIRVQMWQQVLKEQVTHMQSLELKVFPKVLTVTFTPGPALTHPDLRDSPVRTAGVRCTRPISDKAQVSLCLQQPSPPQPPLSEAALRDTIHLTRSTLCFSHSGEQVQPLWARREEPQPPCLHVHQSQPVQCPREAGAGLRWGQQCLLLTHIISRPCPDPAPRVWSGLPKDPTPPRQCCSLVPGASDTKSKPLIFTQISDPKDSSIVFIAATTIFIQ